MLYFPITLQTIHRLNSTLYCPSPGCYLCASSTHSLSLAHRCHPGSSLSPTLHFPSQTVPGVFSTVLCALLSLDSHTASITTYPKSQIGKTDWNRFTQTHNEFCVSRLYVKYRGKLNSFVHDQPRIYLPMSPLIFLCSGVPSVPSISRELAQSSRVI